MSKRVVIAAEAAGVVVLALAVWWFGFGRVAAGGWVFSQSEDGIQAMFLRNPAARDAVPLFRMVCNEHDGVVWFNSQTPSSRNVDKEAARQERFDLTLRGEGTTRVVSGYVSSAPERSSLSWEAARDADLLRILSAPDFALTGPSLALGGGGSAALADFVRACPVAETSADALQWRTRTSIADGFRIDIPHGLFRIVWGDRFGRGYQAEEGAASLVVMASANALQLGLADAIKGDLAGLPQLDRVTYRHVGRDSAVISGLSGRTIVYHKVRSTCGGATLAWFTLAYDEAERVKFDPIVARMARSFDRTTLPDGSPICP